MTTDDALLPPDGGPACYSTFTHRCFHCGATARVRNGKERWHGCHLRLLSRIRWTAYLAGWHDAHRFAVQNLDDPLVLADAEDYGSGWAAYMRKGGGAVEIAAHE